MSLSASLVACQGAGSQASNNREQGSTAQPRSGATPGFFPAAPNAGVNPSSPGDSSGNAMPSPVPIPAPSLVQTNDPYFIPTTSVVWAVSSDGSSLEAITRADGQIAYTLHLLHRAKQVVKTESDMWIVARDGTLSRFDLSSGDVDEVLSIEGDVAPITVSNGHVWIGHKTGDSRGGMQRPELIELDAVSGSLLTTLSIGEITDSIGDLELIGNSLFILVNGRFGLQRLDTETLQISEVNLGLPEGFGTGVLSGSQDVLWVMNTFSGKLVSLNPESLKVLASIDAPSNAFDGVQSSFVTSGLDLFVMAEQGQTVLKLNDVGAVERNFELKETPQAIAEVSGQLWVSFVNRTVVLNSKTGAVIKKFDHVAVRSFAKSM
jgi:outer membrane protein assembly factor BamB